MFAKILTVSKNLIFFYSLHFSKSKAIFDNYNQKARFYKMSI